MSYNVIPTTGYSVSDVSDTLGADTLNVGALVISDKVNMFARNKPTALPLFFTDAWQDGVNGSCGLSIPLWDGDSDISATTWSYIKPKGGDSEPLRFGDFRGYKHAARPFITSGQVAGVTYEYDAALNPLLIFTFDSSMFADVNNLNPKQVYVDVSDRTDGRTLGDYYWAVLLQGYSQSEYGEPMRVWRAAGTLQDDGIFAGSRLRNGGDSITINLTTADIERMKYRCTATFFMVYPWSDLNGHNLSTPAGVIAVEQQIQNGKKVAVFAGTDPSNGQTYINPVPMTLTAATNGIHISTNPWRIAHDATHALLSLWSSKPVKLDVFENSGIWSSIDQMPDGGYKPQAQNRISIGFNMAPNNSVNPRDARIGLYQGPNWGMSSGFERLEVVIIQDGTPPVVKLDTESVSVSRMPGYSKQIKVTAPRSTTWHLAYITPSLEDYPTNVDWVSIIDTSNDSTMEPSSNNPYTGDKEIVVLFAGNTGAPRTAYAIFRCAGGSENAILTLHQEGLVK